MTGPRLALSLTIVASLVGALASAQDGFQKAIPKRLGFGKATATAPDPVLDWTPIEVASTNHQAVPAGQAAATAIPPSPARPKQAASNRSYEAEPATKAAVATPAPAQRSINFVAPRQIAGGGCTDGCGPTQSAVAVQCGEGAPCGECASCAPHGSQCACDTCAMTSQPQQPQRRRRFRPFQRKRQARLAAKQRTATRKRRQRWWPWLATNDMPAPQGCGCADCTGVAVSKRAGVLIAPVQVTPQPNAVERHQFTVLSELGEATNTQPVPDSKLSLLKRLVKPKRKLPFMDLDKSDDNKPSLIPKKIQRVTQRTTRAVSRNMRRAIAIEPRASAAAPAGFGEWTSGSK